MAHPVYQQMYCVGMQASQENNSNLAVYLLAFFLTTLGIVYVQEAERRIPMNYAQRTRINRLSQQSYLPFKVPCCALLAFIHQPSYMSAQLMEQTP
jgi:protein transport protein SEC61 subunit alpha